MGQNPAKIFPWPTPYGQSPNPGTVSQAVAAPAAPLNNFLPLNPGTPTASAPAPAPTNPLNYSTLQNNLRRIQPLFRGQELP